MIGATPAVAAPVRLRPLRAGHSIRVVQPAYRIAADEIGAGLRERFAQEGLCLDEIRSAPGYGKLSDGDEQRAREFTAALGDPAVGAVLVGHGGYGCMRLLERIGRAWPVEHIKPVIGYSDATALLATLLPRFGPNCIHGPNASSLLRVDGATLVALLAVLRGDWSTYNASLREHATRITVLRPGRARATVAGGNLSVLAALCGTPFAMETRGRLLFLEDWNEPHYRIDRLFTQLSLAGALDGIAGLVLGDFVSITREGEDIAERIEDRVLALAPPDIPIVSRFPAGHGCTNLPLMLGALYTLDGNLLQLAPER